MWRNDETAVIGQPACVVWTQMENVGCEEVKTTAKGIKLAK
jgi:hypothetical protein